MLLFTWTSVAMKTGYAFEAFFRFMAKLGNGPAILLIVIGFIGVGAWLTKQYQYNKQAEEQKTWK